MNGHLKKFIEKEISQQIKRSAIPWIMIKEDECKMETVSIPFIDDGLSHEIRRIARTVGIRCAFAAPNTLKPLCAVKDRLPKEATTHAVYSIKCKSCGGEYVGEMLRQVGVWKKEHTDAVRMGQCSRSAIAEHAHSYQQAHEIDWSSIQVDRARKKTERKIREAFHIQVRKPSMNWDGGVE